MARAFVKPFLALFLLLVCTVFILTLPEPGPVTFKEELIYISSGSRMWPFTVEIAETSKQQQQGLMHREELADGQGMLFINEEPGIMRMWMKNTPLSLDMLFINNGGKIVFIAENTIPYSTDHISYDQPVRAVLELPGGAVKTKSIKTGDRVIYRLFTPHLRYQ